MLRVHCLAFASLDIFALSLNGSQTFSDTKVDCADFNCAGDHIDQWIFDAIKAIDASL
jgi:hypothetical protein